MNEDIIKKDFKQAYNNFDIRPLESKTLGKFYIDDFTKDAVDSIKTTIEISEKYCKMLVIGHRGCGKSTILNKVAEELRNDFYIVSFRASENLNKEDVETVDILFSIYLEILKSMESNKIKDIPWQTFEEIKKIANKKIELNEVGLSLLTTVSFKFKVEEESREILRATYRNKIKELNNNITECIKKIYSYNKKNNPPNTKTQEILIIIDDLDKLDTKFAEQIFFKDAEILNLPSAKIVYTFPLETYYCPSFNTFKDSYEDQFISLVVTDKEKNGDIGIKQLEKMVFKRIDKKYIERESLEYMIISSGGLLRDLIHLMQQACKKVMSKKHNIIDKGICQEVINETANHYKRLFDFPNYEEYIEKIMDKSERNEVNNETLIYLLKYLFVLEYRLNGELWYDVHPCLKKVIKESHSSIDN